MENSSRINLHNRARFYCKKKLLSLRNSFEAWQVRVYSYFFSRLLNQIEQFTESDFQDNSDSETVTYFVLMSDTVKDELSEWSTFWFKYLIKHGISAEAIGETILQAQADFLYFLNNYTLPEYNTPTLPYRKVLSKTEYEDIWALFEAHLLKAYPRFSRKMYYSSHFPVKSIANELQALGLKRLFNLNPMSREASYEVDIELMDEMFCGDDTYWISEALDWFIYAEGNGYPEVAGDVIEEILAKILWQVVE